MRLHITLSQADQPIDFNYQPLLTQCVHKWLGENNVYHGRLSLYSFSWLQEVRVQKNGIEVNHGSNFMLNFYDDNLTRKVVSSILEEPEMFHGARVVDLRIQETPEFSNKERFFLASPVLIKRHVNFHETHYTFSDPQSDEYLTETLKSKARVVGLNTENLQIYFDREYPHPKTKIVSYKGIQNKVNICPVIVAGDPQLVSFAWHVGLGNSTGIGFGALK